MDNNNPIAEEITQDESKKKNRFIGWAIALIAIVIFITVFGFFTVQPIGAIPDGVTLLVIRSGTQLKFFDSADAACERIEGGVSLLCRAAMLSAVAENQEMIILRLPYIDAFYLASTGGARYGQ